MRIRRDSNLERRITVVRRHLQKFYSASPDFLQQLSGILEEAALVTDPERIKKLEALQHVAKEKLEAFLEAKRSINSNLHQEPAVQLIDHEAAQSAQRKELNEEERRTLTNKSRANQTVQLQQEPNIQLGTQALLIHSEQQRQQEVVFLPSMVRLRII